MTVVFPEEGAPVITHQLVARQVRVPVQLSPNPSHQFIKCDCCVVWCLALRALCVGQVLAASIQHGPVLSGRGIYFSAFFRIQLKIEEKYHI